uniref:Anti-silencing function protein 1 n=1 Tax=Caenorhabditis japonica TaxID=281687 RepID=A0A8R1I174_CAEJA
MASRVNIVQVQILDNPAMFTDKFKLEITFEVFEHLPHDLEWELVYVGSGTSRDFDQVLDSALVGPIPEGRHKFVFDAEHPDISKIPADDIVGVSVLLLRCKYNDQEFINLGWFVANEYTDEELKENPPAQPRVDKLSRKVETEDLRVTTFPIKWTDEEPAVEPAESEADRVFAEEDLMPLNDEGQEEDEDEEDDDNEMEAATGEDIDLNESFNERMANALDDLNQKQEEGSNDVEMDDEPGVQISNTDAKIADIAAPLSDKTNEEMIH